MNKFALIAIGLLAACSIASAQDLVLTGYVQRVILQPSGTEDCPPPCSVNTAIRPDGVQTVCVSNQGGCQTMEVKINRVYRGVAQGQMRQFKSRIGEWGPSFPNTSRKIVVSEEAGNISWSLATERDGKIFVDPKRLRSIGGIQTSPTGDSELVALDEVLRKLRPEQH